MYNDGNVFSHGWWGKGHVQPIHIFLGVMITMMIDWKCFSPILIIFSPMTIIKMTIMIEWTFYRSSSYFPLLSVSSHHLHSCQIWSKESATTSVFTEYYSAKYTFGHINQCTVEIIARVKILMLIIMPTLFSGPDESAAVPVIDPANPSQDFSPPASPTWGKKGSQNWKVYLFQRVFNIGRDL